MDFSPLPYWLAAVLLVVAGCSTGPEPRPASDGELDSGEQIARQAGERARELSADDGTPIYATNENLAESEAEDGDSEPGDDEVATLYLDPEGRLLNKEGDDVDPAALDESADEPLRDRVLRLVIDPAAGDVTVDQLAPLLESVADHGAFLEIRRADAPGGDATGGEDQTAPETTDEPETAPEGESEETDGE